jgi:iron complex outermembrane receptor protein
MVDIGARVDVIDFKIKSDWTSEYSWSTGGYADTAGSSDVSKSYSAFSPRIGINYELTPKLHMFASASTGVHSPSEGEINDNPDLELVETNSFEIGLKGRSKKWSFDTSYYYSPVKNEVIKILNENQTEYANAGETTKQGLEFSGTLTLVEGFDIGVSYAYSDYTFEEFSETVRVGAVVNEIDRSGNRLPYVPEHQYSLSAAYRHPSGFKSRIQTFTWGSYYMDNANTEKYEGYEFVTNLMLGFEKGRYDFSLLVDNLFDKRYAVEVTKDTSGEKDYTPAAPRSVMARFTYSF